MSRPDRRSGRGSKRPGWETAGRNDTGGECSTHRGDEAFTCAHCGQMIPDVALGTSQRNHCPHCLWSLHVDIKPGDRRSFCRGPMEPVALWVLEDGEWRLIHRCTSCGVLKANRIAGDDSNPEVATIAARTEGGPPTAAGPPTTGTRAQE